MEKDVETMNEDHVKEAEKWPTLGPTYFSAREVAQRITSKFESEQFKPLIEKFAKEFSNQLWQDVEFGLLSDTECNIQGDIWRDVDAVVEALLGGQQWALQRYVLPDRLNAQQIRETVAKLIPAEIQDKRVADLEEKIRNLEEDLKYYRNRDR